MTPARPWLHVAMDLQDALQAFLVQLRADGRSPHTINQYRRHVTALIAWLHDRDAERKVACLSRELLAQFFADDAARVSSHGGSKKNTSLNAMRTSVRCFCAHLHDAGLVAANPARLLRRARCSPPPPKSLHADEHERLLAVLAAATGEHAERDRMLIELLLGTGMRIGSALALNIEDLDLEHGEITVRRAKNDRPSTVLVPKALASKLRGFVGDRASGPVFLADRRRVSTRHAQRRISDWFTKAEIRGKSAHSLRHTFACGLLAKTGDLRLVQDALSHASVVSTAIYARVDRGRLRAAVGA